jgi:hypothetical protein
MADLSITQSILGKATGNQTSPGGTLNMTSPPQSGPGSGYVPQQLPTNIASQPVPPYLQNGGVCNMPTADTDDFYYLTVVGGAWPVGNNNNGGTPDAAGSMVDGLFNLPNPYRFFVLVSVEEGFESGNRIFFSKAPLTPATAGGSFAAPFPNGAEKMFSFNWTGNQDAPQPVIALCRPITKFYLNADTASGSQYTFTILCTNELDPLFRNGFLAG